jgi:hypothetical protein
MLKQRGLLGIILVAGVLFLIVENSWHQPSSHANVPGRSQVQEAQAPPLQEAAVLALRTKVEQEVENIALILPEAVLTETFVEQVPFKALVRRLVLETAMESNFDLYQGDGIASDDNAAIAPDDVGVAQCVTNRRGLYACTIKTASFTAATRLRDRLIQDLSDLPLGEDKTSGRTWQNASGLTLDGQQLSCVGGDCYITKPYVSETRGWKSIEIDAFTHNPPNDKVGFVGFAIFSTNPAPNSQATAPQQFSQPPQMSTVPQARDDYNSHVGWGVAENGSYYGELNANGVPKTDLVSGYYRRDGTYVRGYYRSAPGTNPPHSRHR